MNKTRVNAANNERKEQMFLTQERGVYLHIMGGVLVVTNKEGSTLPKGKHCQGQLQTAQSLTVLTAS